ncbi:MAG: LysR family transcriptional regulator [Archangium sp.]|nr:LysR family transcriptional regulator [Archangium sp.]MDP3155129.1 LysR family transcriptional regulator [Archangium sp.]MDP3573360.1 LysR family transcriptional regulator [Archangium sp.]
MSTPEPSWELYETFLSVMRTGSLSGASRSLSVAQPTVRRRVEALERALGVVLFTRAPNGLVPTDAARATQPHAEAMSASARALVRATSAPLEAEEGTVRVTASEIIGLEVIPSTLGPLRAKWPALALELALSNRLEDLLRRDADVAVRMTAPTQASLVARRVGVIPLGLFAHEDYLADHPPPRQPEALLKGHALIGADRAQDQLRLLASFGVAARAKDFAIRTDSDGAQLAAVRAGLGIGVCQVPLARRTKGLRRVLPSIEYPLETFVVMHEDQRSVRRVRIVFEHLVAALGRYLKG